MSINPDVIADDESSLILRDYQVEAVQKTASIIRAGGNPAVSMPTGSGKSITIAALARELSMGGRQRIIITVPTRELAEQNEAALLRFFPADRVGVVCASLDRRESDRQIIVGTPQSLAGNVDFDPAWVIIDECHQMPLHAKSQFAKLFRGLPRGMRTPRIGFSATTFRRADGAIYGPQGWFSCQAYEITARELIVRGHLSPVRYISPSVLMTTEGVSISAGDYNQGQLARVNMDLVELQADAILEALRERRRCMVFGITVGHALAFVQAFNDAGEPAEAIIGDMKPSERDAAVAAFKNGHSRIAVTVMAGLTGFDVPEIDLIASCRPTKSPIIHVQSIGRGTRVAEDKEDCLVLDFAENLRRFGPVHSPNFDWSGSVKSRRAPWSACQSCGTYNRAEAHQCGHCGSSLRGSTRRQRVKLELERINYGAEARAIGRLVEHAGRRNLKVRDLSLHGYEKRGQPGEYTVMLAFDLGNGAIMRIWEKYLRTDRWRRRWRMLHGDDPAPITFEEAYARRDELVRPLAVDLKFDDRFWRITRVAHRPEDLILL